MSSINKKHFIWIALASIGLSIIPFFLRPNSDSWSSTLSLSLTIIGTVCNIITIIIVLLLYDRFGITAKFKEKQVWEVIELAILLKNTWITASSKKLKYIVNATQSSEELRKGFPEYQIDSQKALLFPSNFSKVTEEIYTFMNSHWIPKEIKDKMKIFNILALADVENPDDDQYVKINFNNEGNEDWGISIPKLTLEMLNINLHELYITIDAWLKKHSDIAPSFFSRNN